MDALSGFLWKLCSSDRPYATAVTRPGLFEAQPDVSCTLIVPGPAIVSALTGPDVGVAELQQKLRDFDAPWQHAGSTSIKQQQQEQQQAQQPQQQQQRPQRHKHGKKQQSPQQPEQQQAWGHAVSLYDHDPQTGLRNGDPIADCFGCITYENGAVLALADGVNWGERPKLAARAAVYAFLRHLHQMLLHLHAKGQRNWSSSECFDMIRCAVQAAQQQIKKCDGTLTTLVAAVVAPQKWGPGHSMMSVLIGDSPAFVWRAGPARVDEVSYMPPLYGIHRDPRVCPGCLGFANGDGADLSNVTFSITSLQEGDVVFLTSDGIADNFDPTVRKQAVAATSMPGKSPRAGGCSAFNGLPCLSAASCHETALADMAVVLRSACQQPQHVQPHVEADAACTAAAAAAGAGSAPFATVCKASAVTSSSKLAEADDPAAPCAASAGAQKAAAAAAAAQSKSSRVSSSSASSATSASSVLVHGSDLTPEALVTCLINFAMQNTAAQRAVLEAPDRGAITQALSDALSDLPGKMDHACAVAYKVGPKKGSRAPPRNWLRPRQPAGFKPSS